MIVLARLDWESLKIAIKKLEEPMNFIFGKPVDTAIRIFDKQNIGKPLRTTIQYKQPKSQSDSEPQEGHGHHGPWSVVSGRPGCVVSHFITLFTRWTLLCFIYFTCRTAGRSPCRSHGLGTWASPFN